MNKDKSKNPNNKECSSCKQALLDLVAVGVPAESLLEYIESNKELLDKADKLFSSHKYPDKNTTFFKGNRDINCCQFLSAPATTVLFTMLQNMRSNNLLELSLKDAVEITNLSKNTISKALDELIKYGCIAEKFSRNKTRGTVYMVNPDIATTGHANRENLSYLFGKLVDEKYNDYDINPLEMWGLKTNPKTRTYSRGYDSQDTMEGRITFNKINESKIKKPSSAGTPDDPNSSENEE